MEEVQMDAISAAPPSGNQNDATKSLVHTNDESKRRPLRSPADLWRWFFENPFSRWPFALFMLGIPFSCVLLIMSAINVNHSYVPAGIGCVVICGFGAYHFKTLMALIEQVNEYERLNKEFKLENTRLVREVNRLEIATRELGDSKDTLNSANIRSKQCLKKFDKLQSNLAVMGENSVTGMGKVAEMAKEMKSKWKKELLQNQRILFTTVFDEMEFRENGEGMSKTEYNQFLDALPISYANVLEKKMTFNTLAGADGIVDIDEFSKVLDQLENDPTISLEISNEQDQQDQQDEQDQIDADDIELNDTKVNNDVYDEN